SSIRTADTRAGRTAGLLGSAKGPRIVASGARAPDASLFGPRRAGRARRQDRVVHLGLAPGEGAQEGRDRPGLFAVDLAAQLRGAHDRHRLLQVPDLAAVEVGRGQLDVA